MNCDVTSEMKAIVSEVNSASVTFDSKTKVLRKIELSIKDGNFSDALARLKVESCPVNWGRLAILAGAIEPPTKLA